VAYSCTPKMEDHSFLQNVGTYLPKCMAYYIPQDHNLNIIYLALVLWPHSYWTVSLTVSDSRKKWGFFKVWNTSERLFLTFWENCFKLVYSAAVEVSLAAVTYWYVLPWKFLLVWFSAGKTQTHARIIKWISSNGSERGLAQGSGVMNRLKDISFKVFKVITDYLWSLFGFVHHVVDVFSNVSANLLPPSSRWQPGLYGL
jgi:hypothetical protein